jgi:poly-gamma-glutamate synthesis protein (capsule biosynthesis protein)
VGHGPHRLRGVEAYGRGAILYSVGNFIFEPERLDTTALDLYDSGVDLYGTAMGANAFGARRQAPTFNEAEWWEAVIARATFEHGELASLQLVPIDLGVDLQLAQRGFPRLAAADRASGIVRRLSRLSTFFDTRVVAVDGVATVDIGRTALKSR